jgi:hypothetical protein
VAAVRGLLDAQGIGDAFEECVVCAFAPFEHEEYIDRLNNDPVGLASLFLNAKKAGQ